MSWHPTAPAAEKSKRDETRPSGVPIPGCLTLHTPIADPRAAAKQADSTAAGSRPSRASFPTQAAPCGWRCDEAWR